MKVWRYVLGAAGVLLLLYGAGRLVAEAPRSLPGLLLWMVGVVVIHDGLLSPLVVGVGWLLARVAPPRSRRYLQAGLMVAGLLTVIAIPLIARRGSQPRVKELLVQNYSANLAILIGLVAVLNVGAYLLTRARDRRPVADAELDGQA